MNRILAALSAALLLCGCSGTWLMYDTTQKDRVYFTASGVTVVESFALLTEDEIVFRAPVHILGTPKPYERECKLQAKDAAFDEQIEVGGSRMDVFTAREGTDYTVGKLIIPAGAVDASLELCLKRTESLKGIYRKIDLALLPDDEFLPMDADSSVTKRIITPELVLYFTDGEPSCPEWWNTESKGVDYQWGAYYGKFSPAKFRLMLQYYHAIEGKNPALYSDLVAKYGLNIDKEGLQRNFMSLQDQSVWATYVLIPLHAYYVEYYASHPDEAENFGNTGDLTSFTWGDPMRLLR